MAGADPNPRLVGPSFDFCYYLSPNDIHCFCPFDNSTHEGDTPFLLAARNGDDNQWNLNYWSGVANERLDINQAVKQGLLMTNHYGRDALSYILNPHVCLRNYCFPL
jgi:hypothetical protein